MQVPRTSRLVMETLFTSGIPPGLVSLVHGGAATAQRLSARPAIAAVSFTGSQRTGRQVATLCGRLGKPLQAELGANNAAIVMPGVDLATVAGELAVAEFGFAGQRCTAGRRLIVHDDVLPRFESAMLEAVEALVVGDPHRGDTQVGPLISRTKQRAMDRIVATARRDGAQVLTGGRVPVHGREGCWYLPTLLRSSKPDSPLVQEETFGPLAVIQPARDLYEAMRLANGVPQGLVMSLYSREASDIRRFLESAQAGNLKLNLPTTGVDPRVPFTGWKASGVGPGEHGRADAAFYCRDQTVYGSAYVHDGDSL